MPPLRGGKSLVTIRTRGIVMPCRRRAVAAAKLASPPPSSADTDESDRRGRGPLPWLSGDVDQRPGIADCAPWPLASMNSGRRPAAAGLRLHRCVEFLRVPATQRDQLHIRTG